MMMYTTKELEDLSIEKAEEYYKKLHEEHRKTNRVF